MNSPARQPVLGSRQQRFLLCLAARIVPESAGAPPQVTEPLLAAVDEELRPRPRLQQLEFKLLLFAIRWMTVPFTLHRFERLPGERQDRWLGFLENAPLTLLRVGIWGLKTLVFLGYYTQDGVQQRIVYVPSKEEGNILLHHRQLPSAG
ncbi:MAG: hypothetical protein QOI93_4137 [Rhodospirillaceae bacterium]|jgi:hypothetical protein|nr:hypothetical protein [Rhodospirillaceae bacterium]